MMDVDEVCEHFFRVQDSILRTVAAIYLPEDEDLRTEDFANMSLVSIFSNICLDCILGTLEIIFYQHTTINILQSTYLKF